MLGWFALLLGAVFGKEHARIVVLNVFRLVVCHEVLVGTFAPLLGAVSGGNHLLASPVNAAV